MEDRKPIRAPSVANLIHGDDVLYVRQVPMEQIHYHPAYPYPSRIQESEDSILLAKDISDNGLHNAGIARERPDGGYELIEGYRRHFACAFLEMDSMPLIIKEIDDNAAIIQMVDAVLLAEKPIAPTERGQAYKIRLEAQNRQGMRSDLTSTPRLSKLPTRTNEILAESESTSRETIRKYIRLTHLTPSLQEFVDYPEPKEALSVKSGVELSYLSEVEQQYVADLCKTDEIFPSVAQSIHLKKLSQNLKTRFGENANLSEDDVFSVLTEQKGNQKENIKISYDLLKPYLPSSLDTSQREEYIVSAVQIQKEVDSMLPDEMTPKEKAHFVRQAVKERIKRIQRQRQDQQR